MSSDNGLTGFWVWAWRLRVGMRWQLCVPFTLSSPAWHWTGHLKYTVAVTFLSSAPWTFSLFSQHASARQKSEVLVSTGPGVLRAYLIFKRTFLQAVLRWVAKEGWGWQLGMIQKSEFQISPNQSLGHSQSIYPRAFGPVDKYRDPIQQLATPHGRTPLSCTAPLSHGALPRPAQLQPRNPFPCGAPSSRKEFTCQYMEHHLWVTLGLGRKRTWTWGAGGWGNGDRDRSKRIESGAQK